MSEIKPITPNEIVESLDTIIPSAVIQAVNELLKENYRGIGGAHIRQKDIVIRALQIDESLVETDIYKKKYLDIETLYEKSGWKVSYDSPAYNESYDAYFVFKKK